MTTHSMGKTIGYQIIYPPGCKELNESLKIDELRRRLKELSNSLDQIIEQESCEADSAVDLDNSTQPAQHENLKGLFLLLVSPEYTQHADTDIQLRVGVCICKLMKIFCPHNPFSGMLEERSYTKKTLLFILACIAQLSNVKNKSDFNYPKLHTILYICCQIDVFLWCASLGDEATLFECIKTAFTIVKNVNVWAWTEPTIICQMLLDMVVKVIAHSEGLLTREIITYILQLLIEPARSTQPEQHAFARDVIIRTANHLEYHIQMLLQNALISGNVAAEPKERKAPSAAAAVDDDTAAAAAASTEPQVSTNGNADASDSDLESEDTDPTQVNPLGEHTFLVIYALHTIQDSLVAPILPTIELKLKSTSERERKRSFRLLARLFSEPNSLLHEKNPSLWEAFLGRFNDIDKEVRKLCVHMVPQLLKKNPDLPQERLLSCFKQRAYDPEEDVRLLVLRTVATLVNESADSLNESLFDLLKERSRDKDLSIRKEASTALASIYKRFSQAEQPPSEQLSAAVNTILHMYYLPSVDDRVTVERLFKSSIVPYHLDTAGRVRALFVCYSLIDEASIRAIQEMFKIQYSAINLLRQVVQLLSAHMGQKITPEAGSNLMDRIHHLSNLLPKSEKSVEHLKRFFNLAHSDRAIHSQLVRFTKPGCSCIQAANSMRELLKRLNAGSGTGSAESQLNYARSVKVLLERSAQVLFDKDLGQELLTQLVYVREASITSALFFRLDIVRGLRLLWALTVYFRKILPASEVLDYVVTVLEESSDSTTEQPLPVNQPGNQSTSGSGTEPDPTSVQELALNILCCILDGSSMSSASSESEVSVAAAAAAAAAAPITSTISEPHFPGSESHLFMRSEQLLPLLRHFCCHGLTRSCPPVRYRPPDDSTANPARQPRGRGAPKPDLANPNTIAPDEDPGLYRAGLAWRRERRRAKLAARALLYLYRIASRPTSPKGSRGVVALEHKSEDTSSAVGDVDLDAESDRAEVDSVDTPTELVKPTSRLGLRVQQALDDIMETCLNCPVNSPDYVTCLTTLSRIALLLPRVYNAQFKKLITKTLVQQVLVRDDDDAEESSGGAPSHGLTDTAAAATNKPNSAKSGTARSATKARLASLSIWLPDGCISQTTRAKISALKLMTNWLRGLRNEVKPVAQAVIRLLHRIIVHEGDLTREGKLAPGEMSRMRLTAATSWLKLAHSQSYAEDIEVDWYQSMTYIICDPCAHVRSHFLGKLSQGLMCLQLPLEYIAMFAHAADVADTAFKQRAKQLLVNNVQRRRDFLARHPAYMNDAKFLYGLLPDFVLPYLIYLLAHDPEWTDPNDVARLTRIKSSLWFVMEPIVTRGQNFSFLRKIIEKIKHTRDALAPDDPVANLKLYTVCDISLGLLLTRYPGLITKEYPIEVKLPKSLFAATPASFKNPDFAQILNGGEDPLTGVRISSSPPPTGTDAVAVSSAVKPPLIQFTPAKHGRALKEGLMPPQLLKGSKVLHFAENKSTQPDSSPTPATQQSSNEVTREQQPTPPLQKPRPKGRPKKQTELQSTSAMTSTMASISLPDTSMPSSDHRIEIPDSATLVIDLTVNNECVTSPKKHTRIVLGTPEIESDNTNSPIARIKKRGRPPKSSQQSSDSGSAAKFRKLDFSPPKSGTGLTPVPGESVVVKKVRKQQSPHVQNSLPVTSKAKTRVAAPKQSPVQSRAKPVSKTAAKSLANTDPKSPVRKSGKPTRAAAVQRPARLSASGATQKLLSPNAVVSVSSSQTSSVSSAKPKSPVKRRRT